MTKKLRKEQVYTTLDPETVKKIDKIAEKEIRTRPEVIRIIIEDYFTTANKKRKE